MRESRRTRRAIADVEAHLDIAQHHDAEVGDGVIVTVKTLKGSDRVPQKAVFVTNESIGVRNVNPKK
jgi:hypothetical protein